MASSRLVSLLLIAKVALLALERVACEIDFEEEYVTLGPYTAHNTVQYFYDISKHTGVTIMKYLDKNNVLILKSNYDQSQFLTLQGEDVMTSAAGKGQRLHFVPGGEDGGFTIYFSNGHCMGVTQNRNVISAEGPRWCEDNAAFIWFFGYNNGRVSLLNLESKHYLWSSGAGKPLTMVDNVRMFQRNEGYWKLCNPEGTKCYGN